MSRPARSIIRTALAALAIGVAAPVDADAQDSFTFAIVPQQAAAKIVRLWSPVLTEAGKAAGITFRLRTTKNIPTFEAMLAEGAFDFAYMNPYHFTVFNEAPGYRALAKQRNKRIQGIVVVRKDNPISDIAELDGLELAFPSPAAFAASILPRAAFRGLGLNIRPKYVSSHDSVYRAVSKSLLPAGGGIVRTFNNADETIRDELRILWKTDAYTPHALAVHPRVDRATAKRAAAAFIGLWETIPGRKALAGIGFEAIEAAEDDDWDDIRALNIQLLQSPGN